MFPRPPDTFPEPPGTFPGYNGPISFEANNDDLALLVVHYLKHCNQLIYFVSSYMFPRLPDLLTEPPDTFPRPTDTCHGPPDTFPGYMIIIRFP